MKFLELQQQVVFSAAASVKGEKKMSLKQASIHFTATSQMLMYVTDVSRGDRKMAVHDFLIKTRSFSCPCN